MYVPALRVLVEERIFFILTYLYKKASTVAPEAKFDDEPANEALDLVVTFMVSGKTK